MIALAFLRAHWKLIGIGLLLALLALQTHRIALWKAHSASLEAAAAKQVSDYREAYNLAVAQAYAEKQQKEQEYEAARQQSASAYADLSQRYRSIVLRLPSATDPGRPAETDLPERPDATGLPAEPSPDTLVLVSRADAMICAENTAYSLGAYQWAKSLTEAGHADPQ